MKKEYLVTIDEITYPVLFSDEKEALLAAKAAGRAVLGLWDEKIPQAIPQKFLMLWRKKFRLTKCFWSG